MLSDRSYMRDAYPREKPSALAWLMSAIIAGFVVQTIAGRVLNSPGAMEGFFQLSVPAIRTGHVWTLLTYSFLHDINNLLLILSSLLALYFLGRNLQPMLGWKRFLGLYVASTIFGGLAWLGVHWTTGGTLMGAGAAAMGLFTVYACFYPVQPVTFLVFFVVPVTVKPRAVLFGITVFHVIGCFAYEIFGARSPFVIAHSAHLGAIAAGWLYYRYIHDANWRLPSRRAAVEPPAWVKKQAKAEPANFQVNVTAPVDVRAEVDRILDKINSEGFGALSAEEKRLLDDAKDLLSRR